MVIIENLQYLSRQGQPFRGHNYCESNFYQLLLLRSKDIPQLKDWLMKKKGKYISHDIQNELLSIMSHQVLNKLLVLIRDTIFSLICKINVLLTLGNWWFRCIWTFHGILQDPWYKSNTIVSIIKDIMIRLLLQFDKCRGQCYAGTSNMLGKTSGVAMQIKELQTKAHYINCHGHSISLSVKKVTEWSNVLGSTMGVAEKIVVLIKYSPKWENILGCIKEQVEFESEPEEKANDITKLLQTR